MAAILPTVASLAPYHIMAYGTLLGTELYQVRIHAHLKPRAGLHPHC
jgi:hypothetical protein